MRFPAFDQGWSRFGVLSGSLFSGGFRSLGSGNLGCGFGFLHHGLLRAHRLGDELDDGAEASSPRAGDLDDTGVATFTLLHLLGDLGEQVVHDGLVADDAHHATTVVQITTLGERDQTLCQRTKRLAFGSVVVM